MRQLLLVLLGRIRRGAPHVLGSGLPLMSLALVVVGCASHSLMPETQAGAIKDRDRALAPHAAAIHAAIGQSGNAGALAFLDARDGRLVVLPGDSSADAWSRYTTSPEGETGRVSVPPVLTFVHRADVPKAPETVTRSVLQQQQAVAALATELRDAHRRIEEQLGAVQRELTESIAATKREADARADMQTALTALSEELATARKFMLQTAQLGWLNHELNLENASGIGKVATASQELSASSERLEETLRQLSKSLAEQLKELANRLDTIQGKVSSLK
jgi:hypothetical protein